MSTRTGTRDRSDRLYLALMVSSAGAFAVGSIRAMVEMTTWMFPTSPSKDSLLDLAATVAGMFGLPLVAGFSAFAGVLVGAFTLSVLGDRRRVRDLLTFRNESSLVLRVLDKVLPRAG